MHVRLRAVQHMREFPAEFSGHFFEQGYEKYLESMARNRTWGDELTLKAVAAAFETKIHVITSTKANWYVQYDLAPKNAEQAGVGVNKRQLFITYIHPSHYCPFSPNR